MSVVHCRETRKRILVALWAYAYEVANDPLVSDAEFDALAKEIDVSVGTARPALDAFFRNEFDPSTGQWVHRHPEIGKLAAMYAMARKRPGDNWLRFGAKIIDLGTK